MSKLELWEVDGRVRELPDPEKHGAPNRHQLAELLGCTESMDDLSYDQYRFKPDPQTGKPGKMVSVLFGSGDGEKENKDVTEQLRSAHLVGPVIVAEKFDYIANYNDDGEGDDT